MIISWGGTLVCVTFEVAKNCKFASECFSKLEYKNNYRIHESRTH